MSKAYRVVDVHARHRLRQCLCAKHKVKGQGTSRFPDEYLDLTLGLVKLQLQTRNFPWAKRDRLVRKPDAGNPHVRFDERDVETERLVATAPHLDSTL